MDQEPIPDDALAETMDLEGLEIELDLVEDVDDGLDAGDADSDGTILVSDSATDRTELIVTSESAKTIIVSGDEMLDRAVIFLGGLRDNLMRRRLKRKEPDLSLAPEEKEFYFDGLGLSDDELICANALMAKASGPDSLEKVIRYLRDIQILRFQRRQIGIELDPVTKRDDKGRPMENLADFGLNQDQQGALMRLLHQAVGLRSIPNDAMHLLLTRPAELSVLFSGFLSNAMDIFRCPSAPYVAPDYSLSPFQAIRQTGCAVNIKLHDRGILRELPKYRHTPKEGDRIIFFQMARDASPADVEERYRKLGLRPIDPWEFLAFNAKNPNFLKHKPNTTYWVVDGDWRLAACYTHEGEDIPRVAIKRPVLAEGFVVGWFFAGLPIEA